MADPAADPDPAPPADIDAVIAELNSRAARLDEELADIGRERAAATMAAAGDPAALDGLGALHARAEALRRAREDVGLALVAAAPRQEAQRAREAEGRRLAALARVRELAQRRAEAAAAVDVQLARLAIAFQAWAGLRGPINGNLRAAGLDPQVHGIDADDDATSLARALRRVSPALCDALGIDENLAVAGDGGLPAVDAVRRKTMPRVGPAPADLAA